MAKRVERTWRRGATVRGVLVRGVLVRGFLSWAVLASHSTAATVNLPFAPTTFSIGNSLTQDTRPQFLPDSEWHVYCAKNLQYIFDNPSGHCATSSRQWDDALVNSTYDYVIVQPHFGTTVSQDASIIGAWIDTQPSTTKWVIHTGWTRHASLIPTYDNPWDGTSMTHHPDYFNALMDSLTISHPSTEMILNPASAMLRSIAEDVALGMAPDDQLGDLYRDDLHMSSADGHYLQHNLLRTTLGLPLEIDSFPGVPADHVDYLNSKVEAFRLPTDVWVGTDSGPWSVDANWQDGVAPAPGGGDDQLLKFEYSGIAATPTFTNDLAGTFTLQKLVVDSPGDEGFALAGNALRFVANSASLPLITATGVSPVAINMDWTIDDATTIEGIGPEVTVGGVVSGTGGLVINRPGSRTVLSSEMTYSGPTVVRGGELIIAGSVVDSVSMDIEREGRIELLYDGSPDKLGAAQDVGLAFGELEARNPQLAAIQEDFGQLILRADSTSTIVLSGGLAPIVLNAASLQRESGAIAILRGAHFGGVDADQLRFASTPLVIGADGLEGTASRSILPMVIGDERDSGGVMGFVTYDQDVGVTLLDPQTEYATAIAVGTTSTDNVRLTSAADNVDAASTINSLLLDAGGKLAGGGSVSVTSGNVLALDGLATIDVATLELAASEGAIWTVEDLAVSSTVIADDFIKAGAGNLTLSGATTVSGKASVLEGSLIVSGGSLQADALLVRGTGAEFASVGGTVAVNSASVSDGGRLELLSGQAITVAGETLVGAGGTVRVDGGTLTTGTLNDSGGSLVFAAGELNLSGLEVSLSPVGPLGSTIVLDSSKTLSVAGTTTVSEGGALLLEGGTFASNQVILEGPDATFSLLSGTLFVGELVAEAGASFNVESGQVVDFLDRITLNADSYLTLSGGSLEVPEVVNNGGNIDFASGRLQLTGTDFVIGEGGLLGPALTLTNNHDLVVSGVSTVDPLAALTLDGGSLTTERLVNSGGDFEFISGVLHLTGSDLQVDDAGLFGADVSLADGQNLMVDGIVTIGAAAKLTITTGSLAAETLVLDGPTAAFALYGQSPDLNGFALVNGAQHELSNGQALTVNGETRVAAGSQLSLVGGRLVTEALLVDGALAFESGSLELSAQGLSIANGELFGPVLTLRDSQNLSVGQAIDVDALGMVRLEAGSSLTAAQFMNHGVLELDGTTATLSAGSVNNDRTIRGTGRILADVANQSPGQIRVLDGERLSIQGAAHTNAGSIEVIGGEINFTGVLDNAADQGEIHARNALLSFNDGLMNRGTLNISFGVSDVFGDVTNNVSGTIVVAGDSRATFFNDVENLGEVRTSAGSTSVFFGDVTGDGAFTGAGTTAFEGSLQPGNSPADVSIAGDVRFGFGAILEIEIGGTVPGLEFDVLTVDGAVFADGLLRVDLIGLENEPYVVQPGNSFMIVTAGGGLSGQFRPELPALGVGMQWELDYSPTSLALRVDSILAADFDGSGSVDGGDLQFWQSNFSTSSNATRLDGDADEDTDVDGNDFLRWQQQANLSLPTISSIPEPTAVLLLLPWFVCLPRRDRPGRWSRREDLPRPGRLPMHGVTRVDNQLR